MKQGILAATGAIGSVIAGALGGWDLALQTLVMFMAIDFASGWVVAAVFHKSKKSQSGGLDSKAGFKGLCKKVMILALVAVGNLLDRQIGASYVRDANELLSIVENASLMGIPIPAQIMKALDILQTKEDVKK